MEKKVVLLTGASSGIGLDTALLLLAKGYKVYGAARRVELMKVIEDNGGKAVYLDLCDEESVKQCVKTVIEAEGTIDILINNSGYGLGGSIEGIPLEMARNQFEVNVFGMMELIQLVLPVMRKNRSGRIINVASVAGRFSSPFTGWYHAAKYSVEALSDALRLEVKLFGIKVSIIEPGPIMTDWGKIHAANIRKYAGPEDYGTNSNAVAVWYEKQYGENSRISKPSVISDSILKACTDKNPSYRYTAGKGAKALVMCKKILPEKVFDFFLGKVLGQK